MEFGKSQSIKISLTRTAAFKQRTLSHKGDILIASKLPKEAPLREGKGGGGGTVCSHFRRFSRL